MTSIPTTFYALSPEKVQQYARDACANLCDLGELTNSEDLPARAQLIMAAVQTRQRFQALANRSRELREALDRFEARRIAIRA